MKISTNPAWLSAYVKARINPPPIPLIKEVTEDVNDCDIIKIKMHLNAAPANSETYELKIYNFKNRKRE